VIEEARSVFWRQLCGLLHRQPTSGFHTAKTSVQIDAKQRCFARQRSPLRGPFQNVERPEAVAASVFHGRATVLVELARAAQPRQRVARCPWVVQSQLTPRDELDRRTLNMSAVRELRYPARNPERFAVCSTRQ